MPHLESYSLMACTFGQEMSEGREIDLLSGLPLHGDVEAHSQFTLNMIPAYPSYAAPSAPLSVNNSFPEFGVLGFSLLIEGKFGIGTLPHGKKLFVKFPGGGVIVH